MKSIIFLSIINDKNKFTELQLTNSQAHDI